MENVTLPDTRMEVRPLHAGVSMQQGGDYQAINEVAKQVAEDDPALVTTSKGLKIRASAIPNMIMAEARRKIKPPSVPKWYNPDKEVTEENPNDPGYQNDLMDYNMRVGTMGATAMLAFGTVVEHKPEAVLAPESEEWSSDLQEIFDIDIPSNGKARYAAWLRLYALTDSDLTLVLDAVRKASGGVTEAEVEEAEDNFRPDAEGNPAT